MTKPSVDEILDRAHVVALPMAVRFRGVDTREALLIDGPAGWGEFAPFLEYGAEESAAWLRAGLEAAFVGFPAPRRPLVEVNATVPAVPAAAVAEVLARYPGCRVDVGNHFYCYSFQPDDEWTELFSRQPELQGRLTEIAGLTQGQKGPEIACGEVGFHAACQITEPGCSLP